MSPQLALILLVAVGYLAAHLLFEWLAKRFLLVSGAEYLLLGLLIGPVGTGLLNDETMRAFTPVTMLALGWIGVGLGLRLHLPSLLRIPSFMYRVGLGEALGTFVLTAGTMAVALDWFTDQPFEAVLPAALVLGAVAACSGTSGVDVVAARLGQSEPIVRQLRVATLTDAIVAVVVLALVLCLAHPAGLTAWGRDPTVTEWAVITVAIGVVGGMLVHLFIGDERKVDRLVIALAASIVLVTGAAAYLQLSPLLPAVLMGGILANTSRQRRLLEELIGKVERPFTFVLLICAGALWQPALRDWGIPVVLFLALRIAGKLGGARLAARLNGMLPVYGPTWGRALLGQGSLAIAIALNLLLVEPGPLASIVFSAALSSVLLTDILSARFAEAVATRLLGPLPEPVAANTGEAH